MKYILPLLIILSSCSASYHCRKCFDKGTVKRDTIVKDTTIVTQMVRIDTVLSPYPFYVGDTLIIHKNNLTIKYKKLPNDTIFLSGECAPDSVRVEIRVPVETEVRTGMPTGYVIAIVIAALLLGGIIVKIFAK